MDWARILAYVTGTVDQELLARNEYLAAENRILKGQLKGQLKLSDAERATLASSVIAWAAKPSPRSQPWLGRTQGNNRVPSPCHRPLATIATATQPEG
jgi:hypothetical protein